MEKLLHKALGIVFLLQCLLFCHYGLAQTNTRTFQWYLNWDGRPPLAESYEIKLSEVLEELQEKPVFDEWKRLCEGAELLPIDLGILSVQLGIQHLNANPSTYDLAWLYFNLALDSFAQSTQIDRAKICYIELVKTIMNLSQVEPRASPWDKKLIEAIDNALNFESDKENRGFLAYSRSQLYERNAVEIAEINLWGESLRKALEIGKGTSSYFQIAFDYAQWLSTYGFLNDSDNADFGLKPDLKRATEYFEQVIEGADNEDLVEKSKKAIDRIRSPLLRLEPIPQFPEESNLFITISSRMLKSIDIELTPIQIESLDYLSDDPFDSWDYSNSSESILAFNYNIPEKEVFRLKTSKIPLNQSLPAGLYEVSVKAEDYIEKSLLLVSNLVFKVLPKEKDIYFIYAYDLSARKGVADFNTHAIGDYKIIWEGKTESSGVNQVQFDFPPNGIHTLFVGNDERFTFAQVDFGQSDETTKVYQDLVMASKPVYIGTELAEVIYLNSKNKTVEKDKLNSLIDNQTGRQIYSFANEDELEFKQIAYHSLQWTGEAKLAIDGMQSSQGFNRLEKAFIQGNVIAEFPLLNPRIELYQIGKIQSETEGGNERFNSPVLLEQKLLNELTAKNAIEFTLDYTSFEKGSVFELIIKNDFNGNSIILDRICFYFGGVPDFYSIEMPSIVKVGEDVEFDLNKFGVVDKSEVFEGQLSLKRKYWEIEYVNRRKGTVINADQYNRLPEKSLLGTTKSAYRLLHEGLKEEEIWKKEINKETDLEAFSFSVGNTGKYELKFISNDLSANSEAKEFWVVNGDETFLYDPRDYSFYAEYMGTTNEILVVFESPENLPATEIFLFIENEAGMLSHRSLSLEGKVNSRILSLDSGTRPYAISLFGFFGGQQILFRDILSKPKWVEGKAIGTTRKTYEPGEEIKLEVDRLGKNDEVFVQILSSELTEISQAVLRYNLAQKQKQKATAKVFLGSENQRIYFPEGVSVYSNLKIKIDDRAGLSMANQIKAQFPELFIDYKAVSSEYFGKPLNVDDENKLSLELPISLNHWVLSSFQLLSDNKLFLQTTRLSTDLPIEVSSHYPEQVREGDKFKFDLFLKNASALALNAELEFTENDGVVSIFPKQFTDQAFAVGGSHNYSFNLTAIEEGVSKLDLMIKSKEFEVDRVFEISVHNHTEYFRLYDVELVKGADIIDFEPAYPVVLAPSVFHLLSYLLKGDLEVSQFEVNRIGSEKFAGFLNEYAKFHGIKSDFDQYDMNSVFVDSSKAFGINDLELERFLRWGIYEMINPKHPFNQVSIETEGELLKIGDKREKVRHLFSITLPLIEQRGRLSRISSRVLLQLIQNRQELGVESIAGLWAIVKILGFDEEVELFKSVFNAELREAGGLNSILENSNLQSIAWLKIFLSYLPEEKEFNQTTFNYLINKLSRWNEMSSSLRFSTGLAVLFDEFRQSELNDETYFDTSRIDLWFMRPISTDEFETGNKQLMGGLSLLDKVYTIQILEDEIIALNKPDQPMLNVMRSTLKETLLAGKVKKTLSWDRSTNLKVGDQLIFQLDLGEVSEGMNYADIFLSGLWNENDIVISLNDGSTVKSDYLPSSHCLRVFLPSQRKQGSVLSLSTPIKFSGEFFFPGIQLSGEWSKKRINLYEAQRIITND